MAEAECLPNDRSQSRSRLPAGLGPTGVCFVVAVCLLAATTRSQAQLQPLAPHHPGRVLVRFKPGTSVAAMQTASAGVDRAVAIQSFRCVDRLTLVRIPRGTISDALAAYRRNPNVLYAEPDYTVHALAIPNDASFSLQWGMHNTGQTFGDTPGADIRAVSAWDSYTGTPSIMVAVIDSGVDYTHPDLVDNMHVNPLELAGNGIDDDGNGWVDDVFGYDFANHDGDPMDDNSHGTHVAGILGARGNNHIGVAGVAWRCKIVPLKFLDSSGSGNTSDAIEALDYVVAHHIPISNNSWGGGPYSQALFDAIEATQSIGHLFVAAAGNDTENNDTTPSYPASYDLPNIISVAATDGTDAFADFTNVGLLSVDLAAPGVGIYSTVFSPGYGYNSGTSMATPHVSGAAALLMGYAPGLSSAEVRDRLISTVRPVAALSPWLVSGGVLNVAAALGDCNGNGVDDATDIISGTSSDCSGNGIPDECEADCDNNLVADSCDITNGTHSDCDGNGVPDMCDVDCDRNGIADGCELLAGNAADCDGNGLIDRCDSDFDGDGIINNCDNDSDNDGVVDAADACPFTPVGTPVFANGSPKGDMDQDCQLTHADYIGLQNCLLLGQGGPDGFPERICLSAYDMDGSWTIDLRDFQVFQQFFTRP